MATDGPLTDLLDALREGGDVDSHGRFTLDRAQARAKMQKFQLADARRYVLELVQAAVLRGATAIEFAIDADDMRMRFDGPPFTAAELDDLWGSIFADGDARPLRAVRQLALGLNAALGLAPKRISICSGDRRLLLRPGRDDEHAALDPPLAGTEIHVERRLQLGLFVDFFRNLGGRLGEQVHLRARCEYAPIPITLDGAPLVRGMHVYGARVEQPFTATGVAGVVALVGDARPAELRLVKDGVWIDTHSLEQCGPGIVAVVAADALRKDVSLAKIVADDALAPIVGLARTERWGLFARLVEAVEARELSAIPWMARMRDEALAYLKLRDLRKRPDAAALARAIGWIDARAGSSTRRWITLVELADTIDPEVPILRHAIGEYPLVAPDGPPVPRLGRELSSVARILGGARSEPVDNELKRLEAREKARRAWLARPMALALPAVRPYLVRAPFVGPGVRGELGVATDAFEHPPRANGATWLLDQGCLLARLDVPWGVPALDMVLEAGFTPTDGFDDVARDAALARAALHALGGLGGPLARWVAGTPGSSLEAGARGLAKAWLQLALDRDARAALWDRLGVAPAHRPDDAAVAAAFRTAEHLWKEGAGLLDVPLFHDFDGAPRSLRQLAERLARDGALDELDQSVAPQPGLGQDVLWLGRGDRTLLAAIFGPAVLRSWQPVLEAILRRQAFEARPARDLADLAHQLAVDLASAGLAPGRWCRTLRDGDVQLVVALFPGRADAIDLLVDGRPLTTRAFDLGIGPLVGAATSPALRPRASWDDVEDDAALARLRDLLRATAWSIVRDLLEAPGERADWLAARLLDRLAGPDAARTLADLPDLAERLTFPTLAGPALTLDAVGAVIRSHDKIEFVPDDTPTADLPAPPVLRLDAALVGALRNLHGADAVVDGSERLRLHGLAVRLESLPTIDRIALDPATVLLAVPFGGEIEGEIGLSRTRTAPGLSLELCTAGRRVGVVTDPDVLVPVDAILADRQLPLTPLGAINTRAKRHAHHLRRCRRAAPRLLVQLCERWQDLPPPDREAARALLLAYAGRELAARDERGQARGDAWAAVRAAPLFVDVWARPCSLDDLQQRVKHGPLDVVAAPLPVDPAWAALDRTIVVADPPARACLAAGYTLRDVDARWAEEVAHLRALADRPEFILPDLAKLAWIDRKATIAGDLQARLWIPRSPSDDDVLIFTRGRREVGRLAVIAGLPCAGHVQGAGLQLDAAGPALDDHQRQSLARQVCALYESFSRQVERGTGRFRADDRERARAWLVHIDRSLLASTDPILRSLGKPLERLRTAFAELAPPTLRRARPKPSAKPSAKPPGAPLSPPEPPAPPAPTQPQPPPPSLEQRFLAHVHAELAWARERHGGLLERLGLDTLRLGTGKQPGLAWFDRGLVLHERHPLVARQLARLAAGEDLDPIDLTFLVSAVYTVMNAVADEIDADDERAFVDRLAAGLARALAD